MIKCSNCGQKTEGDFCQWCGYPVMKGGQGDKVKPKGKPEEAKSVKRVEATAKKVAEREDKEQAKREAEEAGKAKRDAEREDKERAKRWADEIKRSKKQAELKAKKKTKREAEEDRKAERAEARIKRVPETEDEEAKRAKREAEEDRKAKRAEAKVERVLEKEAEVETSEAAGDELYQGVVKLILILPIALSQMRKLEEALHRVEGLRLEAISGSVEGGSGIIVSVENPIPLVDILKGMPSVAEAVRQGKDIRVVLKTE